MEQASTQAAPTTSGGTTAALSTLVDDPGRGARFLIFEPVLLMRILRLGWPVIVGMLTQTLINQVDGMFIGRLDEAVAVPGTAAVGYSTLLLWLFGGFLAAISVGTQALTARRFGEGDVEGAGKVLTNSVTLAITSSVVMTAFAIAIVPYIFDVLHKDPAVRAVGVDFCRVRFLGIMPMVVMSSFKSFYDGLGRVFIHMTIAILMNVINLALCWLLVFGNLGFPRLEVEGAAWAAVVSSAAGTLAMAAWALRKQDRARFRVFRWSNLDGRVAKTVARLSVFSGLATIFVMTGFLVFFAIVGLIDQREGHSGANVAATQLIIYITMFIFMTCIAFGTSTATLVAQSLGAKKPDLAERYGWQSVLVIVLLMAGVGVLVATFPEPILRIFMPEDASKNEILKDEVIRLATGSLRFCGLIIAPIAAAALVLTQALYGAGESRFVMIAEAILHFTCLVPLAWLFAIYFEQGLIGCWYATGVYGAALLLATGLKFWSGGWKKTVL